MTKHNVDSLVRLLATKWAMSSSVLKKKKKVQKSTELVSENSLTGNQNEGFSYVACLASCLNSHFVSCRTQKTQWFGLYFQNATHTRPETSLWWSRMVTVHMSGPRQNPPPAFPLDSETLHKGTVWEVINCPFHRLLLWKH